MLSFSAHFPPFFGSSLVARIYVERRQEKSANMPYNTLAKHLSKGGELNGHDSHL